MSSYFMGRVDFDGCCGISTSAPAGRVGDRCGWSAGPPGLARRCSIKTTHELIPSEVVQIAMLAPLGRVRPKKEPISAGFPAGHSNALFGHAPPWCVALQAPLLLCLMLSLGFNRRLFTSPRRRRPHGAGGVGSLDRSRGESVNVVVPGHGPQARARYRPPLRTELCGQDRCRHRSA